MGADLSAAAAGYALGLSLILAIGAQNAFVLRQGLKRAHVFAVCLACGVSDATLIAFGVAGFGWITEAAPAVVPVLRWGGVAFLAVYGLMAFRAAWRGSTVIGTAGGDAGSRGAAVATALAFTWLNPHVYLDTLVLVGSVASGYDEGRIAFGVGAAAASLSFFFALGHGARLLAPLFARPGAGRALDAMVGALMWAVAGGLALG